MGPIRIVKRILLLALPVLAVSVGLYIYKFNSVGYIDSLADGEQIANLRDIVVSGWAADPDGVSKIELILDSGEGARAFHGTPRPDVVAERGAEPGFLHSGFRVVLTLPGMDAGQHHIALVVTDNQGNRDMVDSKTIRVKPADEVERAINRKQSVYQDNSLPPLGFIDSPTSGVQLDMSENLLVTGWAIDPEGVRAIELVLDEGLPVVAQFGIEREDVQQLYPDIPGSLQSGFRATVEWPDQGEYHQIRLYVIDHLGNRVLADRVQFSVSPDSLTDKALLLTETGGGEDPFRAKGFIDRPLKRFRLEDSVDLKIAGWAIDADGIETVQVAINDRLQTDIRLTVKRPDVEKLYHQIEDSLQSGFEGSLPVRHLGIGDHTLAVFVTDKAGNRVKVAEQEFTVVGPSVWTELLNLRPALRSADFTIAIATSNLAGGGGAEIKQTFEGYQSDTIKVGVRVPILYMRTTLGESNDWLFDPDFDVGTEQDGLVVAEDALNDGIAYALAEQLPLVITLNGGIWSDARGSVPHWDLTDHLEQDVMNCQWNEAGEVMPDNYLSRLPGSESNPQLARALTFNYYADTVRRYKKRNLQQAGRLIREFSDQHPHLFLGINLDPDVYLNPFFHGEQTYDYNPGTVRQFREWLSGSGPYQEGGDLYEKRRRPSLTLEAFNQLTGKRYADWSELKPPSFSKLEKLKALLNSAYIEQWQQFRRHLVDLHYDELSLWLNDTGIEPQYIYSSQGFAADMDPEVDVFPVAIDSPPVRHDTGGVSIEGAVPEGGHLGAIFYGRSATNNVTVETGESLFAEIKKQDPNWAVVEFNPAYLEYPNRQSDYRAAYRALRDMFNFGARFVSPMAWNGWNGIYKDDPGYLSYTSFRNTPLEKAVKDFMMGYADVPRGMILWPFGTQRYADHDEWRVNPAEAVMHAEAGAIKLLPRKGIQKLVLESPAGQVIEPGKFDLLILGLDSQMGSVELQVRGRSTEWLAAMDPVQLGNRPQQAAGIVIPLDWYSETPHQVSQIRLVFTNSNGFEKPLELQHIALYPTVPGDPVEH